MKFDLLGFMPFRLNRLAAEVSAELASEYRDSFGLDIPEWRVMATLGYRGEALSAQSIVQSTRTHKSTISRAVTALIARKLVARVTNDADRREQLIGLTSQGHAIFEELLPKLLRKEKAILSCLSAEEQTTFHHLLDKLEAHLDLAQMERRPDPRTGL
jgi:DNA-binding MarR family transcriptional regulator